MKLANQITILLAVLLISLSNVSFSQTVHTITLNVATGLIENTNVDEVCNFGQDQSIANRDFSITVKKGDTVKWVGVSSDSSGDKVEITGINHEGGVRIFGKNKLNDTDGIVIGVVSDGKPGDEEKYKLSFKVFNNGVKRNGTFHIDPKIKVQ